MKSSIFKKYIPIAILVLWTAALYMMILHNFAFFSDDFGYFLNFQRQLQGNASISAILTSYLTGGVPRLQIGWHVIHQLLFYLFGIKIYYYFLVEVIVLLSTVILFYVFLLPYFGMTASLVGSLILLSSPFFQETFYWVSANYGFFQVFFVLASLLCFRRCLLQKKWQWFNLSVAAFFLGISVLFMEQAIPMLFLCPIAAYFLYFHLVEKKKLLIFCGIWCALTLSLLAGLFIPQFFMIKDGSSTSLADTFFMYYPNIWPSFLKNFWPTFRQTFFGGVSNFQYLNLFFKKWTDHEKIYNIIWVIQVTFFTGLSIALYRYLKNQPKDSRHPQSSRNLFLASLFWAIGASVVVLPIQYFVSRYIFFILPAGIFMFLTVVKPLFAKKWFLAICSLSLFFLSVEVASFYNGPYFSLVEMEKKSFQAVEPALRADKNVKAIVFSDFPGNYDSALSGVFINYHATEWWLRWRSLPNDLGIYAVGNSAYPCKTESNEIGFRVVYGDYPLERLKKCYSLKEILFIERLNGKVSDPSLILNHREPWQINLTERITLTKKSTNITLKLDVPPSGLQFCNLDILADVKVTGTAIGYTRLLSAGNEERLAALSDGIKKTQTILTRGHVQMKGPYSLKLEMLPDIKSKEIADGAEIEFSNIRLKACGEDINEARFVRTNNPDPGNAYLRWTSLSKDFTVTVPYPDFPAWEKDFGIGVNNSSNDGDFYCFPDDVITVFNSDGSLQSEAYLGMLSWKRQIKESSEKIAFIYERDAQDPIVKRGAYDVMTQKEFDIYKRDLIPLDLKIEHSFDANQEYHPTRMTFRSRSTKDLTLRWLYQDSAVYSFQVGTDRGVETISSDSTKKNQGFISTGNKVVFPLVYRKKLPFGKNMASFEFSCDPHLESYFLGKFQNMEKLGAGPENIFSASEKYDLNRDVPHRNHGLSFQLHLKPNETKSIEYFKATLSGWSDEADLLKRSNLLITEISKERCSRNAKR